MTEREAKTDSKAETRLKRQTRSGYDGRPYLGPPKPRREKTSKQPMSAEDALRIWAETVECTGPGSMGGPKGFDRNFTRRFADDSVSIASYVERTRGFWRYRPALIPKYVRGVATEREMIACKRFERILARRLKTQPWIPPAVEEVLSGLEISDAAATGATFASEVKHAGQRSLL